MNSREAAALDRYITGNYGEDQFPTLRDEEFMVEQERMREEFPRALEEDWEPVEDTKSAVAGHRSRTKRDTVQTAADAYFTSLVERVVTEADYGLPTIPGRIAALKARGITNADEDRRLRETFPGEPTEGEKAFIRLMWGK